MTGISTTTPYRPEDLAADWLTDTLRRAGALSAGHVSSIDLNEMEMGQGRAGRVVRLTLMYEGESTAAPSTLIAKFPTTFPSTRGLASLFRLYEREVRFYIDVAPRLQTPTPKVYFSSLDEQTGDFTLLLEDMSPAREGNLTTGCSIEQAAMVVDLLARMHAAWWDSPELHKFGWMPPPNYVQTLEYTGEDARDPWSKFLAQTGDKLPRPLLDLCRKLRNDQSVLDRLAAPPTTLVHGDLRINNVMFSSRADREIHALIDWQTAVRGRGPMDIASLFTSSLQPDDRRIAEAELLPAYHRTLTENGVSGYTFDDCWRDYRLAVANQFAQVVFLSSVLSAENPVEEDAGAATGLRLAAALIELDVASLVPASSLWDRSLGKIRSAIGRLA